MISTAEVPCSSSICVCHLSCCCDKAAESSMKGFKERVDLAHTARVQPMVVMGKAWWSEQEAAACFFPVRKRSAFSPFSSVQDPRPLDGAAHI